LDGGRFPNLNFYFGLFLDWKLLGNHNFLLLSNRYLDEFWYRFLLDDNLFLKWVDLFSYFNFLSRRDLLDNLLLFLFLLGDT